jgi:hypothetical protein
MDKFPIQKAKNRSRFDLGYRIIDGPRKGLDDDPQEEQFRKLDIAVVEANRIEDLEYRDRYSRPR